MTIYPMHLITRDQLLKWGDIEPFVAARKILDETLIERLQIRRGRRVTLCTTEGELLCVRIDTYGLTPAGGLAYGGRVLHEDGTPSTPIEFIAANVLAVPQRFYGGGGGSLIADM